MSDFLRIPLRDLGEPREVEPIHRQRARILTVLMFVGVIAVCVWVMAGCGAHMRVESKPSAASDSLDWTGYQTWYNEVYGTAPSWVDSLAPDLRRMWYEGKIDSFDMRVRCVAPDETGWI